MNLDQLEEEYRKLLQTVFDRLREGIEKDALSREDAERLAGMLDDRIGLYDSHLTDPVRAWDASSWCINGEAQEMEAWNNSGCSFGSDDDTDSSTGWNSSGCSF